MMGRLDRILVGAVARLPFRVQTKLLMAFLAAVVSTSTPQPTYLDTLEVRITNLNVVVTDPAVLWDMDTCEDYERLKRDCARPGRGSRP